MDIQVRYPIVRRRLGPFVCSPKPEYGVVLVAFESDDSSLPFSLENPTVERIMVGT